MAISRRQFILSATGSAAAAAGLHGAVTTMLDNPTQQQLLIPRQRTFERTPPAQFFHQQIRGVPTLQQAHWSVEVSGLVNAPLVLSYDTAQTMAIVEQACTLLCIGNPPGGRWMGHGVWQGVRLSSIWEQVGIAPRAQYVHFYAADEYATCVRLEYLTDALLAFGVNGQALTAEQGFPARIIVPGLYGYKMPKWITRIELSETPLLGFWEGRGWSAEGVVQTTSAIFGPTHKALVSGDVLFSGVAYAGTRGITQVELSIDGGAWMAASIGASLPYQWTTWQLEWTPQATVQYLVRVRATDSEGNTQDEYASTKPYPNGAGGLHAIVIQVVE